jgi:hypothetical protein
MKISRMGSLPFTSAGVRDTISTTVSFFLAHVAHHGDAPTQSDRCYLDTTHPELTFSF